MASQDLPKPDYARNMKLIGHSDQGGRPDGVQMMVNKGHAFVGHMFSKGFSVIDVRDPRNPKPVHYIAVAAQHLEPAPADARGPAAGGQRQEHVRGGRVPGREAVLLRPDRQEGRHRRCRPSRARATGPPAWPSTTSRTRPRPRQIGFMPVEGGGIHRIWYTGGRWAYVSALLDGFTDYIFMTVDMADPTRPKEAGRWWIPGMNTAGGEDADLGRAAPACTTPSSTATPPTAPGATPAWSCSTSRTAPARS